MKDHAEGKMHDCKYFSLALNESTDVMDTSQLLIFTRTIDSTFKVHEECRCMTLLGARTFSMPLIMLQVHMVALTTCQQFVTDGVTPERHASFAGLIQQSTVNCPLTAPYHTPG